ncbi:MAG TPA: DUF423 domain-containing protein [Kofleriaceae bacterium]|nr:DUF423 domain-containing protein [Kofleriaceae bacterium]
MLHRKLMFWGALHGALAVAMGAFAAHALRPRVTPRELEVFEVGARYHMYGALAMLLIALAVERGVASRWPGRFMQAGLVLFCGSLYALALTGVRGLGAITPLGGTCFLLGWLWLAKDALRGRPPG